MPIVFVHGVAMRDPDDPQYEVFNRLYRGIDWPLIESLLREHVAPVLRPHAPEDVSIDWVYWGDLGTHPPEPVLGPAVNLDGLGEIASLTADELGEALQHTLFRALPPAHWAAAVRAVWAVVGQGSLRAQLATRSPKRQRAFLDKLVHDRLIAEAPELGVRLSPIVIDLAALRRRNVRWAMSGVRGPYEAFVPVFVGDVLRYLAGRGRPGEPGEVIVRVVRALTAAAAAGPPGEPFVVLTHSMGGQLVYETLTAFAPGLHVDFWCASGGQVGLFRQLGVFLEATSADIAPLDTARVGYFWNAWSSSDVLSFPAEGWVPGAHDSDFAFTGGLPHNHLAYLRDPDFYRTLAAKVLVHSPAGIHPPRHTRV
ncbi:MAG TPA: hypothetical protein VHM65_04380 [Candidatus Lustribacter sp.]|nr:hypothetical protein [Candidatus Lustribacter sp.]